MMVWFWIFWGLLLFLAPSCLPYSIQTKTENQDFSKQSDHSLDSSPVESRLDVISRTDDAQESANYYSSDVSPYDSLSDYGGFFDNYPSLPYFPEFGEIFRISKTTTQEPPFQFPDYVSDAFSDGGIPKSRRRPTSGSVPGGRRPLKRPPRPASSGTRTKVTKHNQSEPKDKPRSLKSTTLNKSRNYPKIFKFNPDRVNLADFDMKKKISENYLTLVKGDDLDFDKVKRNKFLILHGGVFEIERFRKRGHGSHTKIIPSKETLYGLSSDLQEENSEISL